MTRLPKAWTPHTVKVEDFEGEGANGEVWGTKHTIPDVYVKDVAEVVIDNSGAEVVSRATVRFNLDDTPPEGSMVTIWPNTPHQRRSKAFKVGRYDHPDWPSVGVVWLR